MQKTIPCHIIAGTLGSGKTTAILDFLSRRKDKEFTAVLVNDFGPNGIDSSVISGSSNDLEVTNVSGGCLCCTSAARFGDAFRQLVQFHSMILPVFGSVPLELVIFPKAHEAHKRAQIALLG